MSEITARDRVWAAVLDERLNTTVARVHRRIDREHRPSKETVRRVMKSMSELGVLDHTPGSPNWKIADDGPACVRR